MILQLGNLIYNQYIASGLPAIYLGVRRDYTKEITS